VDGPAPPGYNRRVPAPPRARRATSNPGRETVMHPPTELTTQPLPRAGGAASGVLATGPLAIVGGCGHVGLPLGLAFARQGYQVELIDTSAERLA
ncbi:MAG TPA: hypothetical protein VJ739_00315, partial [Gemmataceae bacterium]|nr:hypothetical protein [Gemmataceae bacterium]